MDKRYRLLSRLGVRSLTTYNQKIADARAKGEFIGNPFSLTPDEPEPLDTLPMIVVVIDELADLMMVSSKKVEELIARIAQKRTCVGHASDPGDAAAVGRRDHRSDQGEYSGADLVSGIEPRRFADDS